MAHDDAEQAARERLAQAFPEVPLRIIASIFAAYRRVTPTLSDTVRAAHRRIVDACSL